MAILKCKMCGGTLEVQEGMSVAECEYCGTTQTVPNVDDEKKITLFKRANKLRADCYFDQSAVVYESIIKDFPEEAEAYWGILLCTYGIEYVDDPATGKKIPTCHRSSFECIMDDSNFELVMENADVVARKVYREEAKAIEEIRKGIIEISGKEEPYDIFICYKETDENGDRTIDSEIAQDVYDTLTDKGYRVFFARITLEDKLGQEYEPYIFAALNSAKLMLVFGTDYEYFNAVWVKNEWSRFLRLMGKDKSKVLIPCYKNVDAYDMPKEFGRLQAQDMGKVGAMQDLMRGVEKLLGSKTPNSQKPAEQIQVLSTTKTTEYEGLLKRAFIFLEDGDFIRADEYCEKVLDLDPENAYAYLGKLMAELKVNIKDNLQHCKQSFEYSDNYKKVLRFADENLKNELANYIQIIDTRIKKEQEEMQRKQEEKKKETHYNNLISLYEHSVDLVELKKLHSDFLELNNFKEAKTYAEKCLEETISLYKEEHREGLQFFEEKKYDLAALSFGKVFDRIPEKEKLAYALSKSRIKNYISTTCSCIVGLQSNGTVVAVGYNDDGQCNVSDWKDIVAISGGDYHTVGLKSDGTVVAVGWNGESQCYISDWEDIVAISANGLHTVGLKSNGTVVAEGYGCDGQCNISDWEDIVAISAGGRHTVGLKSDGTVVAVGDNNVGQCNVSDWEDIVAISGGCQHTVGLKSDGTVVAVGDYKYGQCNVSDWKDIVAISARNQHTVGLKSNGTVVAVGDNDYGQCNVSDWEDIVAISADCYTVGLKSDGTVVAVGDNDLANWDVNNWNLLSKDSSQDINGLRNFINDRIKKIEEPKRIAEEKRQTEEKRIKEIKEYNALIDSEISKLNTEIAKLNIIVAENSNKIFGSGARAKRNALKQIQSLEDDINALKNKIKPY